MTPFKNGHTALAVLGTFLLILGVLLSIFWPVIFQQLLHKELSLSPTSRSFEIWKNTGNIPLRMEVYFFNWTNPHELKTPGKKPTFVELGPYTFLEKREKVNITFHPQNYTVSYNQKKTWYFEPERSNGSLNDNITQLNVVALSAAHTVRYWTYFWQTGLSLVMAKINDIHVTKTVDEFLFTGYSDSLLDMARTYQMSGIPSFDKFGWFYLRNDTTDFDGHYNVATGEKNISNIGTVRYWNYKNHTNFFKAPCNAVEGSAGEFWPPGRSKDEIGLYSVDICRPLIYEFEEVVSHRGISGYKYVIGDKTLSNSTKRRYPHEQAKYFEKTVASREDFFSLNRSRDGLLEFEDDGEPDIVDVGQCYCNGECTPSGLINVTSCRHGAPAFVSLPHFHKADPSLRSNVNGMNPEDEKHGFHITLEPTTGIPISVAARLQVNVLLQSMPYVGLFTDVPKVFFPVFWFNEQVEITEDLAFSLRLFLKLSTIAFYSGITMAFLGFLILICVCILYYSLNKRRRDTALNLRSQEVVTPDHKMELVYVDATTKSDEDNKGRSDRQLYLKLVEDSKKS